MKARGALLAWLAAALSCAASAGEAPPRAGRPGRIAGKVVPPEGAAVVRVSAIGRDVEAPMIAKEMPVKEFAGRLLDGGARYEIDVPTGTYDLHFETKDGLKLEGADMRVDKVVAAEERARPLKDADREAIEKRVLAMKTFENEKHVLAIEGAGDRAKALVKLVRTNPTSYDGEYGEPVAVFRWEVWSFRKRTGSWVRERQSQVLRRFLVPKRKMNEVRWDFKASLGGVDVEAGATVGRDVDLRPPAPAPDGGAGDEAHEGRRGE